MSELQSQKTLSASAATVTLTQNILGAGVLALPYAFKSAGLVASLMLLGAILVMSLLSMGIQLLLANNLGEFSYKKAAEHTLGPRVAVVIEIWVLFYSLGICVSYIVLLGDFLADLAIHFALGSWATENMMMLLAVICVCWPLACARTLGILKFTSMIGVGAILFATLAAVKRYADGTYETSQTNHPALLNVGTFGQCFPILVGAFGAHYNVPGLYEEVAPTVGKGDDAKDKAGFRKMMRVVFSSLMISTILYGVVGIVVYLTFGSNTKADFSENFHPSDGWLVATRLAMTFALCATFPLTMVAARSSVLKILGWELSVKTQIPVSTFLTGGCLAIAEVAGDVSVVLAYNGSIFGTPVCYILPMVMYLCMPSAQQTRGWKTFSVICVITGIIFGILGIVVVTLNLPKQNSKTLMALYQ